MDTHTEKSPTPSESELAMSDMDESASETGVSKSPESGPKTVAELITYLKEREINSTQAAHGLTAILNRYESKFESLTLQIQILTEENRKLLEKVGPDPKLTVNVNSVTPAALSLAQPLKACVERPGEEEQMQTTSSKPSPKIHEIFQFNSNPSTSDSNNDGFTKVMTRKAKRRGSGEKADLTATTDTARSPIPPPPKKSNMEIHNVMPSATKIPPKLKKPAKPILPVTNDNSTAAASQPAQRPPPIKIMTTRVNPDAVAPTLDKIDAIKGIDGFSKRPPPITLATKENWSVHANTLERTHKVNILRATALSDGIRLQVQTPQEYSTTVKYLTSQKLPFFTYRLEEEKELKVVIRGIVETVSDAQIIAELKALEIPVISVRRMGNYHRVFPMVAVQVEKTEAGREIFSVNRLCHLNVSVERHISKPTVSQCHRCQQFGHGSHRCHIPPRCVKCAGPHITADCTRNRNTDGMPKCANCHGDHTASFRGCESYRNSFPGLGTRPKPNPAFMAPPATTSKPSAWTGRTPSASQPKAPSAQQSKAPSAWQTKAPSAPKTPGPSFTPSPHRSTDYDEIVNSMRFIIAQNVPDAAEDAKRMLPALLFMQSARPTTKEVSGPLNV